MIELRPSKQRGYDDKGWLQTYHTFSFDTYYDPQFMGWRSMRVLNEDSVKPGKGFGKHTHREMEIVTYVIEGALEHKDSLGNSGVISQGEVQRITAGTGVSHSEYNLSHHVPVHFLQIWIQPAQTDLPPSYEQKSYSSASKWGQWCLLVSNSGRGGSLPIHQDVDLYSTILDTGDDLNFDATPDRYYWIQVIAGEFKVKDVVVSAGDALALSDETGLIVQCLQEGELLLFDFA